MSFKLDIKRTLTVRSERVKCIDYHDVEPWILFGMYNGEITVWDNQSLQKIKTLEVTSLPVRTGKFVSRKNWIVSGSDDMKIDVFNYNTLERVESLSAHSDFIRCLVVHPTQPCVLSCSDDITIKQWNWEEKWTCKVVYCGHTHFIMKIAINPRDHFTFASGCLDHTIKVWNMESSTANFTLEGHEKGINCVDYYHGRDKPYLISASDDNTVRIWDYQNKTCIQILKDHNDNVTSAHFHPILPMIITGSEDGSVIFWNSVTYSVMNNFNYGFDRCWCIGHSKRSNNLCIGFDHGSIELKLGQEEPVVSMDPIGNQIVWSNHYEIKQANTNMISDDNEIVDGTIIPVNVKDMGICEIYPETIKHSSNGRFIAICGNGEYVVYTSKALRNKTFGSAKAFAWSQNSLDYATWESGDVITIFKNFKSYKKIKMDEGIKEIYSGYFLGAQSIGGNSITFYDWENLEIVKSIEINNLLKVFWSETNQKVCLACEKEFYILTLNLDLDRNDVENENPFEVIVHKNEKIISGIWVEDVFIYNNSMHQLNYYLGDKCINVTYFDKLFYILGYVKKDNRIYCMDKNHKISSYSLLSCVLDYQSALMREDFDGAQKILTVIPNDQKTRLAHIVEKLGFIKIAFELTLDKEHKFELAIKLDNFKSATSLASNKNQWLQIANIAIAKFDFDLAKKCFVEADDDAGLLMLASCTGDQEVFNSAESNKISKSNMKFMLKFLHGDLNGCLDLLIESDISMAALFARSYVPLRISEVVSKWKSHLENVNKKLAFAIADPDKYENLFPELHVSEEEIKEEA